MITLYSTHCPKCVILEKKLREKHIQFKVCDDIDLMLKKGFTEAPMLEVDDVKILNFGEAIKELNNLITTN